MKTEVHISHFKCDHDIRETCLQCDGPPPEYWESIGGLIDQSLIDAIEEEDKEREE